MNRRSCVALLGTYAVCAGATEIYEGPGLSSKELLQFTPIAENLRSAPACLLYEGLPHPVSEAQAYDREVATKKTIRLHDYPFYAQLLPVAADDAVALRGLSVSAGNFLGYRGPSSCLEFHPDFCLLWQAANPICDQLICFGCSEMKLYDSERELWAGIRSNAAVQFAATLKKYRRQRPPRR